MSLKKRALRLIRNYLYRISTQFEQWFRQSNRLLLREVSQSGDPIKEATVITDRYSGNDWERMEPVWVLSTGRTGTNTLTELLRLSPEIDAHHEPSPELFQFSYDYHMGNLKREHALKTLMYLRDELLFRSYRDGFVYVETNNRVTYIADLLLELYPKSKFLHLYRNPYSFIRSGMRRKYYVDHLRDTTRIVPNSSDFCYAEWDNFSAMEKVAWYWAKVNGDCLQFMEHLPDQQKMSLPSERFFEAGRPVIDRLFDFVGSTDFHPPYPDVKRVMNTQYNAQQKGSFSKPENWTNNQTISVNRIIAPVAHQLSYDLITPNKTQQSLHIESDL